MCSFYEKQLWKTRIKKDLEQKKQLKGKEISYMSNRKDMIIHLITGLTKKTLYKNASIISTI